jgi:hypothetical protein
MADVTQKIISANPQPYEGRIVLQAQVANPTVSPTLNPVVNVSKGLTVAQFDTRFTSRFDRPRYYYSTPSGLPY